MEQLPRTVLVGPYRYRVLTDADAQTSLQNDGDPNVGLTDPHNCAILIDPTLAPDSMRATFAHELVHALADLSGLGDDNCEEDWATRLGPQLCDLLRRNPDVVAYLTGD